MIKVQKIIDGSAGRPIVVDLHYPDNTQSPTPVILFAHGFKGYKDWGAFNLMAEDFANAGFIFIKFNFSHNGGTVEQQIDFPDLEAFGQNNYSIELDDLGLVIDNLFEGKFLEKDKIDYANISLIGHSRGGGIAVLKAAEDARITKLITLAGVDDFKSRFPTGSTLEEWRKNGIAYTLNSRTKQEMPHDFQFYEDFIVNENRLTIKLQAETLKIDHLIIHGEADETVKVDAAKRLHNWSPKSTLKIIENAGHTFGMKHPWIDAELPTDMKVVVDEIKRWLK